MRLLASKSLHEAQVAKPFSGVAITLRPREEEARALALQGGEALDRLHLTLAFIGPDPSMVNRDLLLAAAHRTVAEVGPIEGTAGGLGRFSPHPDSDDQGWPLVVLVDAPGLPKLREVLTRHLSALGVDYSQRHGFTPHITLAYVGPEEEMHALRVLATGIPRLPLHFDKLEVALGGEVTILKLDGSGEAGAFARTDTDPTPQNMALSVTKTAGAVGELFKADPVRRYTFAPMYPAAPEHVTAADLDAHADYATAEDLQEAVWDYVRKGDRSLRLQHMDGTEIGEWVEIVTWPHEVSVELAQPDGTTVTKTFPAGTAYMGAVWNEVGWPLVERGLITGYSIGGSCERVAVEVG